MQTAVVASTSRPALVRSQAALRSSAAVSKPAMGQMLTAVRRAAKPQRRSTVVQASGAMEVAQVALDTGLIFGSAATMVGITLVGLAFGFILLRVESLAEEGKI